MPNDEQQEPASEFVPTMISFLQWYFRTLDPKFVDRILAGRTIEQGGAELFASIAGTVRGNRGAEVRVTAADYGLIMDKLAALHLRTRHGDDAVRADVGEVVGN